MATLKEAFLLLRETFDRFGADGCSKAGAALAYYSLFSLFPLLLLLISSLSYLLASGMPILVDARTYVLDSVSRTMPQAGDLIERSIDLALHARGTTGLVGLLTLLWSASNVFAQLYQALNVIWNCIPAPTIRAAIRTKLASIAVVLGISLLLLLSIVAQSILNVAMRYAGVLPGWRLAWAMLDPLVSAAVATLILAFLYRYLPYSGVRWRDVWPGAFVAGGVWALLREVITVYTTRTNYVAVYGAVGSTIALLSWIYLSAQVIFFGAEFSVVFARRRQQAALPPQAQNNLHPDGLELALANRRRNNRGLQ